MPLALSWSKVLAMSFKKPFQAVPIEVGRRYRARARWRKWGIWVAAGGVFTVTFTVVFAFLGLWESSGSPDTGGNTPSIATLAAIPQFSLCDGGPRVTCVVDGDTFWLNGEKIRIADIDTPEMDGRCAFESQQARAARDRLLVLLNQGPFELETIGSRDRDQYDRLLRVVVRSGRSIGDQLVSEGLARTWSGRREPWC